MPEKRLQIAALGSSFAAGPNIEPQSNVPARRSGRNYASQLAEKLDADLTDLTVSGATLLNVLNEPQEMTGYKTTFPAQLDSLPEDTDIVTLTAGGNDLGYSYGMIQDSLLAWMGPFKTLIRWWAPHPASELTEVQLTDRFLAVIDRIKEKAPKATVYLAQYPDVFGDATKSGVENPLAEEQIQGYREQAELLARANESAAKARSGVVVIPVAAASRDHVVGSTEPWVDGFSVKMLMSGFIPYHPNLAGHTSVAQMLYETIKE